MSVWDLLLRTEFEEIELVPHIHGLPICGFHQLWTENIF